MINHDEIDDDDLLKINNNPPNVSLLQDAIKEEDLGKTIRQVNLKRLELIDELLVGGELPEGKTTQISVAGHLLRDITGDGIKKNKIEAEEKANSDNNDILAILKELNDKNEKLGINPNQGNVPKVDLESVETAPFLDGEGKTGIVKMSPEDLKKT